MRSNTPVTPTHHETPPPPLLPTTTTIYTTCTPASQTRKSHAPGCWSGMVAQPRYEADRPVAGVTVRDAQFFLIGHFISTKFSVQQKNTYNRLFNMTSSYLFRLRTDIISRLDQDSQFSLLPATSVARGKKSSLRHFVSGNMRSSF